MKILRHISTIIYIAVLGSIALLCLAMDDVYRLIRREYGRLKIRREYGRLKIRKIDDTK